MGIRNSLLMFGVVALVMACAEGHCRRPATPPAEKITTEVEPQAKSVESQGSVFVYKYDGSLQCQAGKPLSIEAMAKQLKGINILSSTKKSDGLMHIQVCGSITGMANVYEIPATQLKKAEALGFKKWSFE